MIRYSDKPIYYPGTLNKIDFNDMTFAGAAQVTQRINRLARIMQRPVVTLIQNPRDFEKHTMQMLEMKKRFIRLDLPKGLGKTGYRKSYRPNHYNRLKVVLREEEKLARKN